MKVAHHGTKDYYSERLPCTEKLIISNAKKIDWDISAKYALKYTYPKFVCTNNSGCEIYNTRGHDCSSIKKALDCKSIEDGSYCSMATGSFYWDINVI